MRSFYFDRNADGKTECLNVDLPRMLAYHLNVLDMNLMNALIRDRDLWGKKMEEDNEKKCFA